MAEDYELDLEGKIRDYYPGSTKRLEAFINSVMRRDPVKGIALYYLLQSEMRVGGTGVRLKAKKELLKLAVGGKIFKDMIDKEGGTKSAFIKHPITALMYYTYKKVAERKVRHMSMTPFQISVDIIYDEFKRHKKLGVLLDIIKNSPLAKDAEIMKMIKEISTKKTVKERRELFEGLLYRALLTEEYKNKIIVSDLIIENFLGIIEDSFKLLENYVKKEIKTLPKAIQKAEKEKDDVIDRAISLALRYHYGSYARIFKQYITALVAKKLEEEGKLNLNEDKCFVIGPKRNIKGKAKWSELYQKIYGVYPGQEPNIKDVIEKYAQIFGKLPSLYINPQRLSKLLESDKGLKFVIGYDAGLKDLVEMKNKEKKDKNVADRYLER